MGVKAQGPRVIVIPTAEKNGQISGLASVVGRISDPARRFGEPACNTMTALPQTLWINGIGLLGNIRLGRLFRSLGQRWFLDVVGRYLAGE